MPTNKPKIIIANWKMNPASFDEADILINSIKKGLKDLNNIKIVICPPFIYIPRIKTNSSFEIGVQNIFWEDSGAYTGEISPRMARNIGANYAIIGHSERRNYLGENDRIVNLKIKAALNNNLKAILCVGETREERDAEKAKEVISNQIEKNLKDIPKSYFANNKIIIAYEPIWAIGTGETPLPDEIMSMDILIRKIIAKLYDRETADKLYVLYGGSVNSKNALDFVDKAKMNGLLIGGASLNAGEFLRIVGLLG